MRSFCGLLVLTLILAAGVRAAAAADRVRMVQGNQVTGELAEYSPTKIKVVAGTREREFPVNEVASIVFDGEPNELSQARIAVEGGRYDDAVAMLAKIDPRKIRRDAIAHDVEYYKALTAARIALAGGESIAEAGKRMFAFEQAHGNSFHYFESCQVLGDLLAALGRYGDAEAYYNKLATAPWPAYQLRAGVLVGQALVNQQKYDEAVARFEKVLGTDADGDGVAAQKAAATLGKASALSGAGKNDEAIKLVNDVVAKADPEDGQLHARAYNVLGNCHKAAGRNKEAILAFLHVDLLYARYGDLHAEALANLATLWTDVNQSGRAEQARELLKQKYPHSTWAAK